MATQSHQNLESIAREDPVSRPLASLQLVALRAAADPGWERAASTLVDGAGTAETPALHGQRIHVNQRDVTRLVDDLSKTLRASSDIEPALIPRDIPESSALALLEASIGNDGETLVGIAEATGTEPAIIATLGQCAVLPLLLACGRRLMPSGSDLDWEPGYCPVCGSWPLLAELRGLSQQRRLRCNRCAAAWQSRHQRCVYCENTDHQTLGYMAPEAERESRRVVTCDSCRGYLKTFATVTELDIADMLRLDFQSLELDIAATDGGYARPEHPGFAPNVELVPAENGLRRWLPWQ